MAARDPLTLGLSVSEMVQLEDAARLDPQVLLEMTKSPGSAPVTAMLLRVIAELAPLLSVAVCAELDEPTFTDPKDSEVGLMVTDPLAPPDANPDNPTVCGVGLAESLKFKVAVRVPLVFGAKVMFAVQLAFAARDGPQVFEKMLKSAGFAPESVTLVIVIALPLLLASVTIFCAPMPPTLTDAQLRLVGETEAPDAKAVKKRQKAATLPMRIDREGVSRFLFCFAKTPMREQGNSEIVTWPAPGTCQLVDSTKKEAERQLIFSGALS